MNTPPMVQLLRDAGYTDGWGLTDNILSLWEHKEDPPAPLKRPEATDEA